MGSCLLSGTAWAVITKSVSILFVFIVTVSVFCQVAEGQSLSFQLYDQSSGLTNLDPDHLIETRSGILFAATQGASFVFDGHSFLPLGAAQGLPESSAFDDITLGPGKTTIVGSQENRLLVAVDPVPFQIDRLRFRSVPFPDADRYSQSSSLTAYRNGIVLSTGKHLQFLDLRNVDAPRFIAPPDVIARVNRLLKAPLVVFGDGQYLWVSDRDGRICAFSTVNDRCWSPREDLPARRWGGFLALGQGAILARTGTVAVLLDPREPKARIEPLPDTTVGMDSLSRYLRIVRDTSGNVLSQSQHGVVVRGRNGWHALALTNGDDSILPFEIDRKGSIWLGIVGEGIRQYVGWGAIENWTRLSGLSAGIVWSIDRATDGRLWVGTDGGLDLMQRDAPPRQILESRTVSSIASGRKGVLWLVLNWSMLERLDTITGAKTEYSFANVTSVRSDSNGTAWVATSSGLYRLEDNETAPPKPVLCSSADDSFTDLIIDPDGTLWLTGNGMLWRKRPNEAVSPFVRKWGQSEVQTETLAHQPGGPIWVGAVNGLFRVDMSADRPVITKIPDADLPEHTVSAVMIDRAGNVWIGTSNGIAVLHDGRWISADIGDGLVGNDIGQDAIFQDTNDSIWIGTSRGLSHIIRPQVLWSRPTLHPTLQTVSIDGTPYYGQLLAHGAFRLDARIALFNDPHASRDRFRYMLEGIGKGWQDLASDHLVYTGLPPGRHRLLIVAVNPDTKAVSEPIGLMIAIARPWWEQPWAFFVAFALGIFGVWLLLRLRTRLLVRQRAALIQEVRTRTAELERARAELEVQARHDTLTGLLNRGAVQKSLSAALAADDKPQLAVALIDIDYFKQINDTHGHLCGDAVLVAMGQRFLKQLRIGDLVGRFGGEEYVLAIPEGDGTGTQRIRAIIDRVTRDPIAYNGELIAVTVSAGIALAEPDDLWGDIIGRADAALYRAKREGRNRVVAA